MSVLSHDFKRLERFTKLATSSLEGDMTSAESAGAVAPPGLIVNGALAEALLQVALAETVTNCCALTALVEIVRDALLAPTGTVRGPEHAGVVHLPIIWHECHIMLPIQ
jgi:hypothetical protein